MERYAEKYVLETRLVYAPQLPWSQSFTGDTMRNTMHRHTTVPTTVATLNWRRDFILFAETDVTQHKAATKCLFIAPKQGVFLLSHHSHVRFRNVWNSTAHIPHSNSSRKVSTHKFSRSLSVTRLLRDRDVCSLLNLYLYIYMHQSFFCTLQVH